MDLLYHYTMNIFVRSNGALFDDDDDDDDDLDSGTLTTFVALAAPPVALVIALDHFSSAAKLLWWGELGRRLHGFAPARSRAPMRRALPIAMKSATPSCGTAASVRRGGGLARADPSPVAAGTSLRLLGGYA